MSNTRVSISSIVESQLPLFVRDEYPLVAEFLAEYYRSLEEKGSSYDILQNIDEYVKINNLTNLVESTTLTADCLFIDEEIQVENTSGFPNTYGLIYIDNEIILYKSKTETSFQGCVRGFSGITDFSVGTSEDLLFETSESENHLKNTQVKNLSSLFLKEFFIKTKKQFLPGFENRELYEGVNENIFLKQSKDFYTSKGTNRSFEILFRVLYGKDVEVILPGDYLFRTSDAQYRVTRDVVVEALQGNVEELKNKTIFQDEYLNYPKSYGTVTDIEKFVRDNKQYFILKLDYDFDKDIIVSGSLFGELKIHSRTLLTSDSSVSSSTLTVDSTVGFPKSGELIANYNGSDLLITYDGTTVNQFLNCTGIDEYLEKGTEIRINTYAYGYSSTNEEIRFRINGVISDVEIPTKGAYYEKGDIGNIVTLGYNKNNFKDNNWIFNVPVTYDVLKVTDNGDFKYTIETYDKHFITPGDSIEIDYIDKNTNQRNISIVSGDNVLFPIGSNPEKSIQIKVNGYEISKVFTIRRLLFKTTNDYLSDILNVYKDFENDDLYITSSSLPSYRSNLTLNDFNITLEGLYSAGEIINLNSHGFITGDAVLYSAESDVETLGIESGIYFVKKVSNNQIKLARSRSNINANIFVSIDSDVILTSSSKNTISLLSLCKKNKVSSLDAQRLVRKLKEPITDKNDYKTLSGTTGILINGVEILNYKSNDFVYYGPIESVKVISQGQNYDIINPPVLEIEPGITTAKAYCGVEGNLERIDIIDSGYDYLDIPVITISGGGGASAKAIAKMIDYIHQVDFNSSITNQDINLNSGIIGFSTYHRFRNNEFILYKTFGNSSVGGLVNESKYYVKVIDDYKIKLYNTYEDSLVGINTITLTSFGSGTHKFESTIIKKKVNSIVIEDKGYSYKNKKIVVNSTGINTASNTVHAINHPYLSGETIYYEGGDLSISGLTTGNYIVTKVSDNSFKLSDIGIGETSRDFYYKNKQYVDFKTTGSGYQVFNYEPITVTITGKTGITSISNNVSVNAIIQPIFRGKITSVFVSEGGSGYGSEDIVNYNKQPNYTLNSGSGAQLTPIISNGKIVAVNINKKGSGYNSPPDIVINGFGFGAQLTPIISNGKIVDVKIINGGINYEQKNTLLNVVSSGENSKLEFYSKTWNVNIYSRLLNSNKLALDDGVAYKGKNINYGLEYTHLYNPKELRKKVFSSTIEDSIKKYRRDYDNDTEIIKYHSPLLGWAYDGNPIYGPYGYDSPSNKKVRQILSGYSDPIDNQNYRPDKKIFPKGFFVEDFIFNNVGDLDKNNGRFCITPEYPNGTYAYFITLDTNIVGEKRPKFPYIIGDSFKSKPIDFNFDSQSNQDTFKLEDTNLIRNTYPYNTLSSNSTYEYIPNYNVIKNHNLKIESVNQGKIEDIKIISAGNNYKVGDQLVFDNDNTNGLGAAAKVEYIKGKTVTGISQTSLLISDVELYPYRQTNQIIGFTSNPHNLKDADIIKINSLSDYDSAFNGTFNVGIRSDRFILNKSVGNAGVTGNVTYFYVSGILDFPNLRENDILSIESEDIKVLKIEKESSRIKVLRAVNSTVSAAHSSFTVLYEKPRKFFITLNTDLKNKDYKINKELYFNPVESLSLGTNDSKITFSDPGSGPSVITIPPKSIYLKDHQLQTGDQIIYNSNSGIGITVSLDGITNYVLADNSILYVAKISNDFIGISTVKVGLGSTGDFVGIYQTGSTLYFNGFGGDSYHSFRTNYDKVSKSNVSKNTVNVALASSHSLKVNDSVYMNIVPGVSTSVYISYNDYHRKLIVNPKTFSSVDISNNLITILNHGYVTGDKVIHTSTNPASGLENQGIYYVIVYDLNRIQLANTYYDSIILNKNPIVITSSSFGTLSKINPKIEIVKNQKIIFNVSDSSLSQLSPGVGRTSSFRFELFLDNNFKNEFICLNSDGTSTIKKNGLIGVTSTANIEVTVNDNYPKEIYYNLISISNLNLKDEIETDKEVIEFNKISFVDSTLSGKKRIIETTQTSFSYENDNIESINYSNNIESKLNYYTDSIHETGQIEHIQVTSQGNYYKKLPYISSVITENGSDGIFIPQSESIGKINLCTILDIGYNYLIDNTIKPLVRFPSVLRIEPLSTFENIDVLFPGLNYETSPDLIVIDGSTNTVIEDVILDYNMDDQKVTIIKNTKGLYNAIPNIIPVNNSNGVAIQNIVYDDFSKLVTVAFTKEFSDIEDFPFSVGDKVLIEGVSVLDSTDKGFNSKNYNYALFTVTEIYPNLGGFGSSIKYSLEEFLTGSEIPGVFDLENSSGRVISYNSFPKFNITLTKNSFIIGEELESEGIIGKVLKWNSKNEYLTVETVSNFISDKLIVGKTSKSQALIKEVNYCESFYNIKASSIVKNGWNREAGFLSNNLQRLQDSDYYQYFSYSLKSEVSIDQWNDIVSNLNHTLGFKKFSDLLIISQSSNSGISTDQNNGTVTVLSNLDSIINVECVIDYDLVSENNFYIDNILTSDEIIFNSALLEDYSESIGNRVLLIDDISNQFNTSLSKTFVTSFNI